MLVLETLAPLKIIQKQISEGLLFFPTTFMFWVSFSSSLRMPQQNNTKMNFPSGLCLTLGLYWDHFGINLGLFWDHNFGIILG